MINYFSVYFSIKSFRIKLLKTMTKSNKKAKVLFVYPNEREMSTIPPAIALLSQLLKEKGHNTDVFDTTFYEFDDDIAYEDGDKGQEDSLQVRPVTTNPDDDELPF